MYYVKITPTNSCLSFWPWTSLQCAARSVMYFSYTPFLAASAPRPEPKILRRNLLVFFALHFVGLLRLMPKTLRRNLL